MRASCLLFTPRVPDSEKDAGPFTQQRRDLKAIRGAIRHADLVPLEGEDLVFYVEDDVYPELIEKLFAADFVLIDANLYSGSALLSTLFYLMAARHSRDDRALILARSDENLPRWLRGRRNTLIYKADELYTQFPEKLESTVQQLLDGDRRPDNPIQMIFDEMERKKREEEMERRIHELEQRARNRRTKINFRPVSGHN